MAAILKLKMADGPITITLKRQSYFESYRHYKQNIATILTIQSMLTKLQISYIMHEIYVPICNTNMAAILKFKMAAQPNNNQRRWHRSYLESSASPI